MKINTIKDKNKFEIPKIPDTERQLLSILLQNPDIISEYGDFILDVTFKNKTYEEIRVLLAIGILYKQDISHILLKIYNKFPEIIVDLTKNVEIQYIINYRNFMMKFVSFLFEIIKKNSLV